MTSEGLSQNEQAMKSQIAALESILRSGQHLAVMMDLDVILPMQIENTIEVLDCERASLFLYDADRRELYSKIATGSGEIRFSIDRGIAGAAARDRQTVVVNDAYADERFNPQIDRESGYTTRNLLTCPMIDHENRLVGVLQAVNHRGGGFEENHILMAEALSTQAAVAIQRAHLFDAYLEKQRMDRELEIARQIQQGLMPDAPLQVGCCQVTGWNRPADQTGGDAFDYFPIGDDRCGVFLADATGHGVGPSLIIAECRALLRTLAEDGSDPGDILAQVNRFLCNDLPDDRFVTAFFGIADVHTGSMTYCAAGQGPVLYYCAATGKLTWSNATTIPLGIVEQVPMDTVVIDSIAPGDMFVLLTDGFYEYANASGEEFGQDRIGRLVLQYSQAEPSDLITALHTAVRTFAGEVAQADDLTAVIVKCIPVQAG